MAVATSTVIAGAALASLAYGIYSGENQKKEMKKQAEEAKKESDRIQTEATNQRAASDETAMQQRARARQKTGINSGFGSVGPNSTLLGTGFSPNSSIGSSGSGKTDLGS